MFYLILGLVIFLGTHSVSIFAREWRDSMVQKLGPRGWKVLYSVISLAGFILLVHGYGIARQDPTVLYNPPFWTRHVTALLMLPVFPLLLASQFPTRIGIAAKHPMLAATKIWAFAHLLSNGTLADVILFGAFLAWAVIDRISTGKRPATRTSAKQPGKFNDLIAIVGGLLLYVLFAGWAHLKLFGVMPIVHGG
jgi:uncharacterized membrane protein